MTSESLFDGMRDGKFNRKTSWKTIWIIVIILIALSVRGIQIHNQLEAQPQQELAEAKAKENAPRIAIKMMTNLDKVLQTTGITLEYSVDGADEVYFNDALTSPSSGTTFFSQFVPLDSLTTTVYIKWQNKYRHGEQIFTIQREKTAQEIQVEQENIAQEKYWNSPEYRVDEINSLRYDPSNMQFNCQEALKSMLKSPSSADFPSGYWKFRMKSGKIVGDSYVDSQNSFWAQIRTYFECIYESHEGVPLLVDVKVLR